ncbi:hypothetical protein [Algoriphagus boritolerans]|uniref:Uncharacterized protein n=1 Tax=Algoriphagus boritolerans DSM 17298 = JCM 18970 TaxID=1120964 RepID=A0A1H5ZDN9_9BACT|nr:hypothetical protein [Algoriphagus boritolerans]SEG33777.1 hypothetical protein SAMN03080598_03426 [Algoriphagus boritolerans DSM 17298 = JCM 18970]
MKINIADEELDRDLRNLYLDPDKDQHIPLEDDEYFHKIYGKERWEKIKSDRAERGKAIKNI